MKRRGPEHQRPASTDSENRHPREGRAALPNFPRRSDIHSNHPEKTPIRRRKLFLSRSSSGNRRERKIALRRKTASGKKTPRKQFLMRRREAERNPHFSDARLSSEFPSGTYWRARTIPAECSRISCPPPFLASGYHSNAA
jgi:hypothetical protein